MKVATWQLLLFKAFSGAMALAGCEAPPRAEGAAEAMALLRQALRRTPEALRRRPSQKHYGGEDCKVMSSALRDDDDDDDDGL